MSVDLPTEGNPMNPTDATPVRATSNPVPPPPPLLDGVRSSRLSLASLAFSWPRWKEVALFFCVLAISSSIDLILSAVVAMLSSVLFSLTAYDGDLKEMLYRVLMIR